VRESSPLRNDALYGRRGAGIVCGLRAAMSLYYAVKAGNGIRKIVVSG